MALDITSSPAGDGGTLATGGVPAARRTRNDWLRPNVLWGLVGAVIGYAIGHWAGNAIAHNWQQVQGSDQNNVSLVLGYLVGSVGFLAGLGIVNYPLAKLVGRQPPAPEEAQPGLGKFFRYTLDHKVVGAQYLVAMILYFMVGGLFALLFRTELLSPTSHVITPDAYIELVGMNGTMMMMMMTSAIIGPFGNYLVPLMIGSKRVAFPRLEALSLWLTPAAFVVLLSGLLIGGFPTGWTGYAPLAVQATQGMDSYLVSFGLMALSLLFGAVNMAATIISHRAPGMTFGRLPIFVWAMLSTASIMVLAVPVLFAGLYLMLMDRTWQTAFFTWQHGGSPYLWENLFWFFGHPEVYLLALPSFGILAELLPVFARKPAFGYRTVVAGLIGVGVLSFFVWQHHLFMSGMNPDMRPVVMLTTELISVPTGIVYLGAIGTLWRAKIRITVPMLFCLGLLFNFLLGGITGVFISDVPADTTLHGSFFVLAHFHYTIMGGYMFGFFAGVYYWFPRFTGLQLSEKIGTWHFWTMIVFFNSTFLPLFAVGLLGQPRRVFEYQHRLQGLNDWATISAYLLGVSLLIFLWNIVWTTAIKNRPSSMNPWHSLGLEWTIPYPTPLENFDRVPVVLS
ncbi:MAG: cytochrome c oxidase subunit I, partial [Actinomycetes bacterium]